MGNENPAIRQIFLSLLNIHIFEEYEVSVVTGSERHSGTDSRVYLTLVGNQGRRSKKFSLVKKDEHCFRRGSVDRFNLKQEDIGPLSKIR